MPTLTNDKYKMRWQTNGEVEVNVEFNSVATSYDMNFTNKKYLPPPPPPQVFQLKNDRLK